MSVFSRSTTESGLSCSQVICKISMQPSPNDRASHLLPIGVGMSSSNVRTRPSDYRRLSKGDYERAFDAQLASSSYYIPESRAACAIDFSNKSLSHSPRGDNNFGSLRARRRAARVARVRGARDAMARVDEINKVHGARGGRAGRHLVSERWRSERLRFPVRRLARCNQLMLTRRWVRVVFYRVSLCACVRECVTVCGFTAITYKPTKLQRPHALPSYRP